REVRTVAANANGDIVAAGVLTQRDSANVSGIDDLGILIELRAKTLLPVPEIKTFEIWDRLRFSARDRVELVFHLRGEIHVHQLGEESLEQVHHREGNKAGHQSRAALPGVIPALDRIENAGIGAGAADAARFQLLDQARFGEARGRLRAM